MLSDTEERSSMKTDDLDLDLRRISVSGIVGADQNDINRYKVVVKRLCSKRCIPLIFQGRQNRSDHSDFGRTKNLVIYGQSLAISVFRPDQ